MVNQIVTDSKNCVRKKNCNIVLKEKFYTRDGVEKTEKDETEKYKKRNVFYTEHE